MQDIHTRHCCKKHGCKYGENCHVAKGLTPQEGPCDVCADSIYGDALYPIIADLTGADLESGPSLREVLLDPPYGAFDKRVEEDEKLIKDLGAMLELISTEMPSIAYKYSEVKDLMVRVRERIDLVPRA